MTGRIRFTHDGPVYELDGKKVSEEEFRGAFPPKLDNGPGPSSLSSTPANVSDALACHPKDVESYRQDAKRRGVPTEFQRDGRPVMTSRAHQKAYLKAYGYHNNDGGYGD